MGGAGNAAMVLKVLGLMIATQEWRAFFLDFNFPSGFYDAAEYRKLLAEAGLEPLRVELTPKDMTHEGAAGLAKWIAATWLPFVKRVPRDRRERFVAEFVARYVEKHPPDSQNLIHVPMVRLEVEAVK